jgi:hypothetical protein
VGVAIACTGYRTVTQQKALKRRVRARMAKTGERYTTARAVIGRTAEPSIPENAPGFRPPTSEDAIVRATGHGWAHWFAILDAWGGTRHPHPEIARWLSTEQGVPPWWTQSITVAYEQARGLRLPGQHAEGFSATATKTVGVPVERLFEAFVDDEVRARWLPGISLRLRTAKGDRTARFDWEDGGERLVVGFETKGESKATVAIDHQRLTDAGAVERRKAFWRERLVALKAMLES